MADVLIRVDGVDMPNPSKLQWGLQDISVGDSGRDDVGLMHKGRIGQKRKISLEWSAVTPSTASTILTAFNPEYISVRYHDTLSNSWEVRTFYVGDRTGNVKMWTVDSKLYETISFDIIER